VEDEKEAWGRRGGRGGQAGLEKAGRHGDGVEKLPGGSGRQEGPGGRLEEVGEETTRHAGDVLRN